MIGTPLTSSITKYGRPLSVVPASSTLAMFGWSIIASACRSASKRAITCRVSMPGLMIFERDRPLDRLGLLGHEDDAHAAFADLLQELVGADRIAGAFGDGADVENVRRFDSGGGDSRKLPACSWRMNKRFHAFCAGRGSHRTLRRDTRQRSAGSSMSSAAMKIVRVIHGSNSTHLITIRIYQCEFPSGITTQNLANFRQSIQRPANSWCSQARA